METHDKLAKFVNDTMLAKNLSGYDVEAKAKRANLSITQSYVNRIKVGKAGNISAPKQQALAVGLGVKPQQIYDIVNNIEREPTNFDEAVREALTGAENFSEELKADLLTNIKRLVFALEAENEAAERFDESGIAPEEFKFIPTRRRKTG